MNENSGTRGGKDDSFELLPDPKGSRGGDGVRNAEHTVLPPPPACRELCLLPLVGGQDPNRV